MLRGKQREAAPAGHHATDVVPLIDVSGSGDPVAQPDSGQNIVIDDVQGILGGEAGEAIADERALGGHHRGLGKFCIAQDLVRDCCQGQPIAQKIKAGHRVVVEDLAVDFRSRQQGVDRLAAVEATEITNQGRRRVEPVLDGGPIADEPAKDCRPLVRQYIAPDGRGVERGEFTNQVRRGHGVRRGGFTRSRFAGCRSCGGVECSAALRDGRGS